MRVLHVMASGERGGGADHLLGVLPELTSLGVDCVAAVGSEGPLATELSAAGFELYPLDLMHSRSDPRGVASLGRIVRTARPNVVHLHGTRAAFYGAFARLFGASTPTVYTAHGLSYRKERTRLRRAAFLLAEGIACRGATRVISVSRADLEDLERRHLVAPGRGCHIGNAVRLAGGDRTAARALLGLADGVFCVGTVSRLVEQKSVATLVDAAAQCSPGIRLVIIGDGPERWALARQATRQRVDAAFLGERDDVGELLPGLDLFVLSSKWEGEPVALLEAMGAGLPCVATATEGAREVLSGCGVLVSIGQPEQLARAIDALRSDGDERARLGRAGRAAASERTFDRVAQRLVEVYSACDRSGSAITEPP